jgi:hypothetical protein
MAVPTKLIKVHEPAWNGLRVESRKRDMSIARFVDYMIFGNEAGLPKFIKKKR